jgi:hypothetical protein
MYTFCLAIQSGMTVLSPLGKNQIQAVDPLEDTRKITHKVSRLQDLQKALSEMSASRSYPLHGHPVYRH